MAGPADFPNKMAAERTSGHLAGPLIMFEYEQLSKVKIRGRGDDLRNCMAWRIDSWLLNEFDKSIIYLFILFVLFKQLRVVQPTSQSPWSSLWTSRNRKQERMRKHTCASQRFLFEGSYICLVIWRSQRAADQGVQIVRMCTYACSTCALAWQDFVEG